MNVKIRKKCIEKERLKIGLNRKKKKTKKETKKERKAPTE